MNLDNRGQGTRNSLTHLSVGGAGQSNTRLDGRTRGVPGGAHPGATSDPGKRSYSRLSCW